MLANSLTKVEHDGTVAWLDLRKVMVTSWWQPALVWKLNGIAMKPLAPRVVSPNAPPSLAAHLNSMASVYAIADDDSDEENTEQPIEQVILSDAWYSYDHGESQVTLNDVWYSYNHEGEVEAPLLSCSSFWVFDT
jgi:hypothetical protein